MNVSPYFSCTRITRSSLKSASNITGHNSLRAKLVKGTTRKARVQTVPPDAGTSKYKRHHVKIESDSNISESKSDTESRNKELQTETALKDKQDGDGWTESSVKVKTEFSQENTEFQDGPDRKGIKKEKWEPPLWRKQLENIYTMRKHRDAPVDTMGCDVISDATAAPEVYRYQVLLSLMLSSQTKDQITHAAMKKLRQHGCNIDNILRTSDQQLGELIYPVGFWKRKVEYIKKTSEILKNQYNNDIPDTVEKLCKLPGVGPKMAYLVMKCAWNQIEGIGVDTHVHRISNRLGWFKKPTKQPEDTRKELEDWLPREFWSDINHMLVGFGQQTCLPQYPKCSDCLNKDICPFGQKETRHMKSPKRIKQEVKDDIKTEIKEES